MFRADTEVIFRFGPWIRLANKGSNSALADILRDVKELFEGHDDRMRSKPECEYDNQHIYRSLALIASSHCAFMV
jgi:hypothetical protein